MRSHLDSPGEHPFMEVTAPDDADAIVPAHPDTGRRRLLR